MRPAGKYGENETYDNVVAGSSASLLPPSRRYNDVTLFFKPEFLTRPGSSVRARQCDYNSNPLKENGEANTDYKNASSESHSYLG